MKDEREPKTKSVLLCKEHWHNEEVQTPERKGAAKHKYAKVESEVCMRKRKVA